MDYKRLFLLFTLGLIALWLWQAWQLDYPAPKPVVAKKVAQDNNDVPAFNAQDPQTSQHNLPPPDTTTQQKLITVTTDTLIVRIDPQGGNVVYAALRKYPIEQNHPDKPVVLLNENPETLYLAQSGLISSHGPDNSGGQALFQSAKSTYDLAADQKNMAVDLTWKNAKGLTIVKRFTFTAGSYDIGVSYDIDNQSNQVWQGRNYNQIKRKAIETKTSLFHIGTYLGAAISTPDNHYDKISFDDMADNNVNMNATGGWVAMLQHYFLSAWAPDQQQQNHFYSRPAGNDTYVIGTIGPIVKVSPGATAHIASDLYVGPAIADNLKAVAPYLDLSVDYGWLWFISVVLFWLMKQIHLFIGNWGWSIVLVTVVIKAMFYKLSATSYRSMAKMRRLQPKMQQLKQRLGDDRSKFSQAMMELYRKEKVNPMSGCLPILVQIPVFIALYWVLIESVELRQAPFIFWIHDLSVKDPYFVLPILMGLSMFIQQRLNPTPPDLVQAKVMMILPFVFTLFFLNFPAGLVLYWTVNNSISILQQWYITRKINHQLDDAREQKRLENKKKNGKKTT